MLLKGPAQQLADFMIQMSLKYHNEEWAFGLEYELWNEVTGAPDLLTDQEVSKLKEFADWCDGWIFMSFGGGTENLKFILLNEWKEKYQKEKPF
mgnify:CR=1 FL=1